MKKSLCLKSALLILSLFSFCVSNSQTISTAAGTGIAGYSGDGGPASAANISAPHGMAIDSFGNIYFTDVSNQRIRKISTSGIITTIAGNGSAGYSGDGGAATAARLNNPFDISIDTRENLYIGDISNERIRVIQSGGIIKTIAGTGVPGYSGDGGPATAAKIQGASSVLADGTGNVYISDGGNHCIRKINVSGIINTIAGNGSMGYAGDGGPATAAELNYPGFLCFTPSGELLISDNGNHRIRKLSASGIITTVVGNGTGGYSGDGGAATSAEILYPSGIDFDQVGNLYVSENGGHRIREVAPSGIINTFAGTGSPGYSGDGGPATSAMINAPVDLIVNKCGNLYFADRNNQRIRKVSSNISAGVISGVDSICPGDSAVYVSSLTGGTWTTTNTTKATISSTGKLHGLVSGIDTIRYIVSNPCGADTASFRVIVRSHSSCTLGYEQVLNTVPAFTLYPNPSSGTFTFNLHSGENEIATVTISNVMGEKLYEEHIVTNKDLLIKLNAPNGVYMLNAFSNGTESVKQIIILQ